MYAWPAVFKLVLKKFGLWLASISLAELLNEVIKISKDKLDNRSLKNIRLETAVGIPARNNLITLNVPE